MEYKRVSFCGPAGNGLISNFLSALIVKILIFLKLNLEKSCENHDIDWTEGPKTSDDIKFALSIYNEAREQKGPTVAWIVALVGFFMVRGTAIFYKLFNG